MPTSVKLSHAELRTPTTWPSRSTLPPELQLIPTTISFSPFAHVAPPSLCPYTTVHQLQPNINEKMRAILIDWLVEVHLKFRMVPETLFLTINVLDRFLGTPSPK